MLAEHDRALELLGTAAGELAERSQSGVKPGKGVKPREESFLEELKGYYDDRRKTALAIGKVVLEVTK